MVDFPRLLKVLNSAHVKFIIVGGAAAIAHGSASLTQDLDIVYSRDSDNIKKLVQALSPYNPYLRGAPVGLPFRFDEQTVKAGLNFTLVTDLGDIDLLGEITGGGGYEQLKKNSIEISLFGLSNIVIDLPALIRAKRAAGRPKDLETIAELELLLIERS